MAIILSEEDVSKDACRIVAEIRDFSRGQKELWQKIPWTALKIDGLGGYSSQYSRAYEMGIWEVSSFYVDLATGDLVYANWPMKCDEIILPREVTFTPANEDAIISMAFRLDSLNASKVRINLEKEIDRLSTYSISDKEKHEKWREEIITKYNLKPVFTR